MKRNLKIELHEPQKIGDELKGFGKGNQFLLQK